MGFGIYHTSASVVNIIIAFSYGWKLTLVVLALAPILSAATALMTKVSNSISLKIIKFISNPMTKNYMNFS